MSNETQLAMKLVPRIVALLRGIGPYALIELVLPGGSLIALLIWLCRRNEVVRSIISTCLAAINRHILCHRPLSGSIGCDERDSLLAP